MQIDADKFAISNPSQGSNFFPKFHSEEDIQRVIFDNDYLDYIKNKQRLDD